MRLRSLLLTAALAAAVVPAPVAEAATRTFTGISVTRDGQGYALASTAGEVYAFGTVAYRGNASGFTGEIRDISVTADGQGYAMISSAGQVYAFGTVAWRGNPSGFSGSMVGISVTANGQGYVAISSAGQVYAYNVPWRGNPGGFTGSIVGISLTADGQGYAAISSAGQVYAYNVPWRGNPGGFTGSITGISVTSNGQGYVAVSSAGQVYAYNAGWFGNPGGFTNGIVGIAETDGNGYAAVSGIGQVYAYGNVVYRGNGDPGTTSGPYSFVLPRSSVNEDMLDNPHHDYPASDVAVPTGTRYYAVVAGWVSHTSSGGSCGLGYVLNGDDGVQYTYCHGSSRAVASGARVSSGQYLGNTGNTGQSTGPHLHFQIRYGGALRCPQSFLVALYRQAPYPDPKTLPTTGCYY